MNPFHPQIAAALAATISLAACIAPPAAPTIPVAPGPSKTLEMFGRLPAKRCCAIISRGGRR
jgi:hypothetical protein